MPILFMANVHKRAIMEVILVMVGCVILEACGMIAAAPG